MIHHWSEQRRPDDPCHPPPMRPESRPWAPSLPSTSGEDRLTDREFQGSVVERENNRSVASPIENRSQHRRPSLMGIGSRREHPSRTPVVRVACVDNRFGNSPTTWTGKYRPPETARSTRDVRTVVACVTQVRPKSVRGGRTIPPRRPAVPVRAALDWAICAVAHVSVQRHVPRPRELHPAASARWPGADEALGALTIAVASSTAAVASLVLARVAAIRLARRRRSNLAAPVPLDRVTGPSATPYQNRPSTVANDLSRATRAGRDGGGHANRFANHARSASDVPKSSVPLLLFQKADAFLFRWGASIILRAASWSRGPTSGMRCSSASQAISAQSPYPVSRRDGFTRHRKFGSGGPSTRNVSGPPPPCSLNFHLPRGHRLENTQIGEMDRKADVCPTTSGGYRQTFGLVAPSCDGERTSSPFSARRLVPRRTLLPTATQHRETTFTAYRVSTARSSADLRQASGKPHIERAYARAAAVRCASSNSRSRLAFVMPLAMRASSSEGDAAATTRTASDAGDHLRCCHHLCTDALSINVRRRRRAPARRSSGPLRAVPNRKAGLSLDPSSPPDSRPSPVSARFRPRARWVPVGGPYAALASSRNRLEATPTLGDPREQSGARLERVKRR